VTSRPSLARTYPTTVGLLVLIGVVFLLEEVFGGSQTPGVILDFGANYPPLVLEDGQWWRLLTATVLHIGLVHLLVNAWALWQLGRLSEITFGSALTLALFVFTGLCGTSLGLLQDKASAGASGALFGLEGALVSFFVRLRDRLTPAGREILRQLFFWSALVMGLGFVAPGIDWVGHLGGFLGGLAVGWVIPPPHRRGGWTRAVAAVAMILLVAALAAGAAHNPRLA